MEITPPNSTEVIKPKTKLQRKLHKLKKPALYTAGTLLILTGLYKLFYPHDKPLGIDLHAQAQDPGFWQKEIMRNKGSDTSHVHFTDAQKSHLGAKLNGTHFVLAKDASDEKTPESQIVWGYFVKNKGDMVGDTVANVSNTMLAVTSPSDKEQTKDQVYTQTQTSIIQFNAMEKENRVFFDHITKNTMRGDQVLAKKNTTIYGNF